MNFKIPKIKCIEAEKQYRNKEGFKTFIGRRVIPVAYIIREYGGIEEFIQAEKGTIFEADRYAIIDSKEYDLKRYINYIL
ncbi:hypothetical protein [Siminovitchia sp. 179-K 8D1 HS]|uniref:hypothetical protein n=1 Tax=Siminovitchia sp. 179-K 8D1 HS TaxID=3142385 RepID=UPI00399FCD08